ncbi:MAG: hypothetical protein QN147_02740 [Armatimonadota bacterium]|jgi:hypothetical protein|nr:hypothetical protein [Armatimonadota bacterium]
MFYKLRQRYNYWRFEQIISAIHETPPLRVVDSNLRILSMIAERDIPMYLMAAKVLYRRLGHGRFVCIIDRDLPQARRDELSRHLGGGLEFVILEDIPVGRCQRGGTWERLLSCLDWSERHYVVQMDADTLAMGDIPEARDAIAANRAFTLAESIPLQTFDEAVAWMKANVPSPTHIIDTSQLAFERHPDRARLKYVRASSGFAGFAQGAVTRALAEDFHVQMEALVGKARWREWGTEQVASNFVVANSPDPVVLPYPDYATVGPRTDMTQVRFGHFIGSYRFSGQRFAHAGAALIREMLSAQAA